MSKIIIYFLTILILLSLNITMPKFGQGVPNFLFLFVLLLAFKQEGSDFLWVAFFSGLLLDIFAAPVFGSYLFSFMILAMIVNTTTRTLFSADVNMVYMGIVIFISNLLLVGMIYLINALAFQFHNASAPLSPLYLSQKIWLDVILNLVFAIPIYYLIHYLDRLNLRFSSHESI